MIPYPASQERPPIDHRPISADREERPYAVIGYHLKDLDAAKEFAKALRTNVIVRATGEVIAP